MVSEVELAEVAKVFVQNGTPFETCPLGHGNIHDTFLLRAKNQDIVVQRLNSTVFPFPEGIINNFNIVTQHLTTGAADNSALVCALPVTTRQNTFGYESSHGNWWRAQTYVQHRTYQELQSTSQARRLGRILGHFHNKVQNLNPQLLAVTLPNFHNLNFYWQEYSKVCQNIRIDQHKGDLRYCSGAAQQHYNKAAALQRGLDGQRVASQIIHGDPKLENFMFDDSGKCLGLLDLDTVGSGCMYLDLGDCLRSCCNRAGERGGCSVSLDLGVMEEVLRGYFKVRQEHFSADSAKHIYRGILHICFELALRFFTDYLKGNVYFKVLEKHDNLSRAISQFQLVELLLEKREKITEMIHDIDENSQ